MPPHKTTPWPTKPRTVFFDDVATAPTRRQAERDGRIIKITRGVWSADTTSDPADIVSTNIWAIVARFMPDAVVVDRSAAHNGRIDGGIVTVATDSRASALELPGVTVAVRKLERHTTDMPWTHGLTLSSPARTLADNLAVSRTRDHTARTLSNDELRDWLAHKALTWDADQLTRLRADATNITVALGHSDRVEPIEALFAELDGSRPIPTGATFARAVRAGAAWDQQRINMFEQARDIAAQLVEQPMYASDGDGELPFFEAYFSNFIEGTEFTIDEAREIVESQTPPAQRSADGHDVLGTHHCVVDPVGRAVAPRDPDTAVDVLRARHSTIMAGRPDTSPGDFKQRNNRAGRIEFVDAELVEATLLRGYEIGADLDDGFARAVYVMFVTAEVHPFVDGNGRAARIQMNAELSSAGLSRIVIPTLLRNEYIDGLRFASRNNGDVSVLARVLAHAWRWTAAMPWQSRSATAGQLVATNATMDSTDAANTGQHLLIP